MSRNRIKYLFLVLCVLWVPRSFAQKELKISGIGLFAGMAGPERPVDESMGFSPTIGMNLNFFNINENMSVNAIVEYWRETYNKRLLGDSTDTEFKYSKLTVGPVLKWKISDNETFNHYWGGGFALGLSKISEKRQNEMGPSVEKKEKSGFGLYIISGLDWKISPTKTLFLEAKYHTQEVKYFGVVLGVNFSMKKK